MKVLINKNQELSDMLHKQRLEFKTIFDACPILIIYKDNNGKVIRANKAAADHWQMDVKEIIGKDYYQLIPTLADQVQKDDSKVIKSGKPLVGTEYTFKTSTGCTKTFKVDKIPYYEVNDKVAGVISFAQDISKIKETEQEMEEINQQLEKSISRSNILAQEAIEANYAKSEFLANTSHEIRTPMNAIMGFANILLEDDSLDEEQKKQASLIKDAASSLIDIINDVLDVSKIEAGKMQLEIRPCDITDLLTKVSGLLEPLAGNKNLDFKLNMVSELPGRIMADPVRLRQCIINLVGNALKFTKHGHVYINALVDIEDGKEYVRIDIEDTGIGISTENQQKIFNPFSQAEAKTTRKYGGTGLGLSITKELIEMMNGEISVYSVTGQGSIFSLRLPCMDKNELEQIKENLSIESSKEKSKSTSKRLLIAEDNAANRMLLEKLLEKIDIEVVIVENGKEAVEKFQNEEFGLIMLDLNMPVMDGRDAAKIIRQNNHEIGMLALTADADENSNPAKFSRYGFDGLLAKPIKIDKIKDAINEYIEK